MSQQTYESSSGAIIIVIRYRAYHFGDGSGCGVILDIGLITLVMGLAVGYYLI